MWSVGTANFAPPGPIVSPVVLLLRGRNVIRTSAEAACTVETTIFICNAYDAQIDFGPITAERLSCGDQLSERKCNGVQTPNSSEKSLDTKDRHRLLLRMPRHSFIGRSLIGSTTEHRPTGGRAL